MELIWNEIGAPRLICRDTAQAEIEGTLPPPQGKNPSEILDYTAETELSGVKIDAGKLEFSGKITAKLIALDENGEVFSFVSESSFSRSVSNEEFESGQSVSAQTKLSSLSIRQATDRRILIDAVIDMDYFVTTSMPLRVLSGVSGVSDMEFKKREASSTRRVELGSSIFRLSEEISDAGDNVLSHSARVCVRDTAFEDGGVTVGGTVTLNIVCKSAQGDIIQLTRNLPFRENVETSGAADEVYASAKLRTSSVRALGTEFSLLSFDADIELTVYALRSQQLTLPLDAFSPSINFSCIKQKAELISTLGSGSITRQLRENMTVPDGLEDIFTPLYVSSRPLVTSIEFSGGEMLIDGLFTTRLVYRSGGGRLYSFSDDIPFSVSTPAPVKADMAQLNIGVSSSVTGGSPRAAQISYQLDAFAEFFTREEIETAAGLVEKNAEYDENAQETGGLIIYTALKDETLFDIAKRFRIPSKRVIELNPDCEDGFKSGQKVLLMV